MEQIHARKFSQNGNLFVPIKEGSYSAKKVPILEKNSAQVAPANIITGWIRWCLSLERDRQAYSSFYLSLLTGLSQHSIKAYLPAEYTRTPLTVYLVAKDRKAAALQAKNLHGDFPYVIFSGITPAGGRNYKCTHATRYVKELCCTETICHRASEPCLTRHCLHAENR